MVAISLSVGLTGVVVGTGVWGGLMSEGEGSPLCRAMLNVPLYSSTRVSILGCTLSSHEGSLVILLFLCTSCIIWLFLVTWHSVEQLFRVLTASGEPLILRGACFRNMCEGIADTTGMPIPLEGVITSPRLFVVCVRVILCGRLLFWRDNIADVTLWVPIPFDMPLDMPLNLGVTCLYSVLHTTGVPPLATRTGGGETLLLPPPGVDIVVHICTSSQSSATVIFSSWNSHKQEASGIYLPVLH